MAVAYIRKSGSDFIAWTDVGGQYREETRTLPTAAAVPVFVLDQLRRPSRRFLLTNPDGYSLTYNGLVMAVEKRRSNGWQAFGSYTFSRAYGLQASSGATAADAQVSTVAPAFPTPTFGRDPNNLTNAHGRLPNDRPHMFRVMGTIDVPRTGSRRRGQPAVLQRQAVGGDRADVAAAGRPAHPARAARVAPAVVADAARPAGVEDVSDCVGSDASSCSLDVLNALNDTAEEALATDNLFSPNFGQPTVFVDPRRAMLGVRLNLGR